MIEGDVFCRKCGFKSHAATSAKAGFCPKCGHALRQGARYCDLCGRDCSIPEWAAGPHRTRRGRPERGRWHKTLLLAVLCCLIGAGAFAAWLILSGTSLRDVLPFEWNADGGGGRQAGSVSGDSAPQPDAAAPVEGNAPGASTATPPGDAAPDEHEPATVPASAEISEAPGIPETSADIADTEAESGDTALPQAQAADAPASADLASGDAPPGADAAPVSEVGPVSSDVPQAAVAEEGGDVSWTELDRDGYSFLTRPDRFVAEGETLSLRGAVSGDHVNVRAMPSTRGRVRRQFDSGVSLDVTGRYASGREGYYWFQVRYGGEVGWIYGEFMRVESTDSSAPVSPAPPASPAASPDADATPRAPERAPAPASPAPARNAAAPPSPEVSGEPPADERGAPQPVIRTTP